MPSLDDCYLRRDRAREHLQELESLCLEVCEIERNATVVQVEPETTLPAKFNDLYTLTPGNTPIPKRCNILVGEFLYNSRASLDYLVRNLSELNSGQPKPRTQFPIESKPCGFRGKIKSFLKGVKPANVAMIERLQPYRGCNWTGFLACLSNLDKHNELVPVFHEYIYDGVLDPQEVAASKPTKYTVKMNFDYAIYIDVREGLDLLNTLQEIESGVTKTLDAFNSEFG